jgi:hypothetical protein
MGDLSWLNELCGLYHRQMNASKQRTSVELLQKPGGQKEERKVLKESLARLNAAVAGMSCDSFASGKASFGVFFSRSVQTSLPYASVIGVHFVIWHLAGRNPHHGHERCHLVEDRCHGLQRGSLWPQASQYVCSEVAASFCATCSSMFRMVRSKYRIGVDGSLFTRFSPPLSL